MFKGHARQELKEKEKEIKERKIAKDKGTTYKGPKKHTMTYQCNLLTSMEEEEG